MLEVLKVYYRNNRFYCNSSETPFHSVQMGIVGSAGMSAWNAKVSFDKGAKK